MSSEQLSNALEDFVLKKIPSAIGDTIEHALSITQSYLSSERDVFELCTDKEAILKSAAKFREDAIQSGASVAIPRSVATKPTARGGTTKSRANDDMELQDDDDDDDDSTGRGAVKGRGAKGRGGTAKATSSRVTKPRATVAAAPVKSTRGRGKAKVSYRVDDDDEEEEEEFVISDDEDEVEIPDDESEASVESELEEPKKPVRGKAKPAPKPKAPPKKEVAATRAPAKRTPKEPVRPVSTPKPTTSSGTRILASGRSQRKSQDLQLSAPSVADEIEEDSEEDRYQKGKRSRSGIPISQSAAAVDLTGDDAWSSSTKKTPISHSSSVAPSSTSSSTRKPPTQLHW
jgi:hypothetical protein